MSPKGEALTDEQAGIVQWVRLMGADTGHFTSTPACEDFANQLAIQLVAPEPAASASLPEQALAMQPRPVSNSVPGKVHCAKCGFTLLRTNLYVSSGTTGPGGEETEPCPNDGNPLLPMTWEAEAREAWATCEELFDRAIKAEKALAAPAQATQAGAPRAVRDLVRWHQAEACHLRYAATTTAMDKPQLIQELLRHRADFHDKAADLIAALSSATGGAE